MISTSGTLGTDTKSAREAGAWISADPRRRRRSGRWTVVRRAQSGFMPDSEVKSAMQPATSKRLVNSALPRTQNECMVTSTTDPRCNRGGQARPTDGVLHGVRAVAYFRIGVLHSAHVDSRARAGAARSGCSWRARSAVAPAPPDRACLPELRGYTTCSACSAMPSGNCSRQPLLCVLELREGPRGAPSARRASRPGEFSRAGEAAHAAARSGRLRFAHALEFDCSLRSCLARCGRASQRACKRDAMWGCARPVTRPAGTACSQHQLEQHCQLSRETALRVAPLRTRAVATQQPPSLEAPAARVCTSTVRNWRTSATSGQRSQKAAPTLPDVLCRVAPAIMACLCT